MKIKLSTVEKLGELGTVALRGYENFMNSGLNWLIVITSFSVISAIIMLIAATIIF